MDFYRISSVAFRYPKQKSLFEAVSFAIKPGESIGFCGANGTGKTTMAKLMTGILKPQQGLITLEGTDISKLSLAQIGRRVGYVFQNPDKQLFTPTVYEAAAFGLRFQKKSDGEVARIADYWLGYFGLEGMEDRFPLQLSRGQKQRLVLAATLARGADFFIMDEPTSGLDPYHIELLSECIGQLGKKGTGYIIISHDSAFLNKHVDRKYSFSEGGVIADEVG